MYGKIALFVIALFAFLAGWWLIINYDKYYAITSRSQDIPKVECSPILGYTHFNAYDNVLKSEAYHYLSPINSYKDIVVNISYLRPSPESYDRFKNLAGDIFRTAYGLTPFTTEDGRDGWIENGVVYRPRRKDDNILYYKDANFGSLSDFESYVPYNETLFFKGRKSLLKKTVNPKLILWYARNPNVKVMPGLEQMRSCPDFPCRITTNRKYASNSSAMIFDGPFMEGLPPERNSEQVFVFYDVVRPGIYGGKFKFSHPAWRAAFNWTMTYRSNSDIPVYYGLIRKRPSPLTRNYKSLVDNKTKMAAGIFSHCQTPGNRENYIKALQKFIEVDIYGDCGAKQCSRGRGNECDRIINASYKFFLAFENSVCQEYITETFFRFMSLDIILVVRGGQGYWQHVLPEIFINTEDFESPKHLAEHLIHLDQHPEEYEAMLREKSKYVSIYEAGFHSPKRNDVTYVHNLYEAIPFCRMCYWLWNLEDHAKCEPDIVWWFNKRTCREPKDFY